MASKKEIRNIIFDMGGVLLTFSPEQVLAPWFSSEDFPLLKEAIFESNDWWSIDAGLLSEEAALARWRARTPERLHGALGEFLAHWHETCRPIEGMAELIARLQSAGYHCYLLSNTSTRVFSFRKDFEALARLEGLYLSCVDGFMKPDPAIYHAMAKKFGVTLGECYFIDDTLVNVEASRAEGMRAFRFLGDVNGLCDDLRANGVRI